MLSSTVQSLPRYRRAFKIPLSSKSAVPTNSSLPGDGVNPASGGREAEIESRLWGRSDHRGIPALSKLLSLSGTGFDISLRTSSAHIKVCAGVEDSTLLLVLSRLRSESAMTGYHPQSFINLAPGCFLKLPRSRSTFAVDVVISRLCQQLFLRVTADLCHHPRQLPSFS